MKGKGKIAITLTAVIVAMAVSWAYNNSTTITTHGTIKVIGVEVDVDSINWGTLEPSSTGIQVVCVKPNGTTPITLTMNATNFEPPNAGGYMTLSWNYTGYTLAIGEWYPIELSLYIHANITGITTFSFDVTIYGNEV